MGTTKREREKKYNTSPNTHRKLCTEMLKKRDFTINDTPSKVAIFSHSHYACTAKAHTKFESSMCIYHHLYSYIHHMQIGSTYPFQMLLYVKPELCSPTQKHPLISHTSFFFRSYFDTRIHTHIVHPLNECAHVWEEEIFNNRNYYMKCSQINAKKKSSWFDFLSTFLHVNSFNSLFSFLPFPDAVHSCSKFKINANSTAHTQHKHRILLFRNNKKKENPFCIRLKCTTNK